ncbi:unnamed protein product [Allacma fusca]|uniref:Uncharacterized protein n=1 Tax=Allacma fusca TaxID=39272 RepID=A0A8J2P891_9HEXA|nr:unnamed protein product [Allacma fusca]
MSQGFNVKVDVADPNKWVEAADTGSKNATRELGDKEITFINSSRGPVVLEHVGDMNFNKKNVPIPPKGRFIWSFKAYNSWFNTSSLWCNLKGSRDRRVGFSIFNEGAPKQDNKFEIFDNEIHMNGHLYRTY